MSKIYNQLKEIQEQKRPDSASASVSIVSDGMLPPFSRSVKNPIPKNRQFQPNALFFLIVAVSSVAVIALFLVARTIGVQKNLTYEKTTLSSRLTGIKSVVNENAKGLGLLTDMMKGLNGSIKSMDERLEAANARFARIERQGLTSATEINALRKENSALLERVALLEKHLNIKKETTIVVAPKRKKLLGL